MTLQEHIEEMKLKEEALEAQTKENDSTRLKLELAKLEGYINGLIMSSQYERQND